MENLFLLTLIVYIWTYFSIFCHEMGHFTFAKLVGMSPYLVKVGVGYKPLTFKFFNTRFEFRIIPYGGITHAYHLTFNSIKLRCIVFLLGGVFANCILLVLLITLLKIQGNLILLIPIIIEIILLFTNLIPSEIRIYQTNIQNDGKQIVSALITNYRKIFNDVFEAYNKQLYRYKSDKENLPKTFLCNDVRMLQIFIEAQTKLYTHHAFEEAVELLLKVLKFPKISDLEKAFILDDLACIVAMQGYKKYLNDADKWSQEAITLASHCKTLKGTRGAILIELGRYDEGKQLLLPLTEPDNEALDIAISSCYIAKAEYVLGNIDRANAWLIKAKKIGNADANTVLNRIQQEINYYV
jgi:hypothetical protein